MHITKENIIYENLLSFFSNKNTGEFVGMELEYPIVSTNNLECIIENVEASFNLLKNEHGFHVTKVSNDNKIVALKNDLDDLIICLEFSHNTVEIVIPFSNNLVNLEKLFLKHFVILQTAFLKHELSIIDVGFNQSAFINKKHRAVNTNHYKKVEALNMFYNNKDSLINNTLWTGYLASQQIHVDVKLEDLCDVLNVLTDLEFINDLFFVNSAYVQGDKFISNFRNYSYQNSGLALIPNTLFNYPKLSSIEELITYIGSSGVFFDGQHKFALKPITLDQFLESKYLDGYLFDDNGNLIETIIQNNNPDLNSYRCYKNFAITKLGTIETRIDCSQPLEDTMMLPAYYLGIFNNIKQVQQLIKDNINGLQETCYDKTAVKEFTLKLYDILFNFLLGRGYGEEKYLTPLLKRVNDYRSPSDTFINKALKYGGFEFAVMERVSDIDRFYKSKLSELNCSTNHSSNDKNF